MSAIPAFGPWTEQDHLDDRQKSITSTQKSETTLVSVDPTAKTVVFLEVDMCLTL